MSQYRPNEETSDPEEIRRDIEATRSEMGSTIDALQEKLNPDSLKAQVQEVVTEQAEHVKEQVQDAITHQVETVKANVREATVGRVETMVSNVSDTARSLVGEVSDTARSIVGGGGNDSNAMRGMSGMSGGTSGAGGSIMDTIKANPVPAAMIGLGLGWLLANRGGGSAPSPRRNDNRFSAYGDSRSYDTSTRYNDSDRHNDGPSVGDRVGGTAQAAGDKLGDVAQGAKERVGGIAEGASERVSNLTDQASERVGAISDRAQHGAQQAKGTFQQTLDDNPLMVGAVAIALGLAAGLALPGTEAEDRMLGESRDNLVGQAQAKAQETFEKVQQVAQEVQPTLVDAAKSAVQDAKETAKESAQKQGLVGQPNN